MRATSDAVEHLVDSARVELIARDEIAGMVRNISRQPGGTALRRGSC